MPKNTMVVFGAVKRCFVCEAIYNKNCPFYHTSKLQDSGEQVASTLKKVSNFIGAKLYVPNNSYICERCYIKLASFKPFLTMAAKYKTHFTEFLKGVLMKNTEMEDSSSSEENMMEEEINDDEVDEIASLDAVDANEENAAVSYINEIEMRHSNQQEFVEQENIEQYDTDIIDDFFEPDNDEANSETTMRGQLTESHRNIPTASVACKVCGKQLNNKKLLKSHMIVDHKEVVIEEQHIAAVAKTFKATDECNLLINCNLCGTEFQEEDAFQLHLNTHEGKVEGACRHCEEIFENAEIALEHTRLNHEQKKKHQCETCGKKFAKRLTLESHKVKQKIKDDILSCHLCPKTFKTRISLKHHIVQHNTGQKRVNCNICGKTLKNQATLKEHMRIHQPNRPIWTCEICGKRLREKFSLKAHMKTHELKKKILKCPHCPKIFTKKGNLKHHVQKIHMKMKFTCIKCNDNALDEHYLTLHNNKHKGLGNLECCYCGRYFASETAAVRHLAFCEIRSLKHLTNCTATNTTTKTPSASISVGTPAQTVTSSSLPSSSFAAHVKQEEIKSVVKDDVSTPTNEETEDKESLTLEKLLPPVVDSGKNLGHLYFMQEKQSLAIQSLSGLSKDVVLLQYQDGQITPVYTFTDTQQRELPEGDLPQDELPEGELPEGELPEEELPQEELPEGEYLQEELPEEELPEEEYLQEDYSQQEWPQGEWRQVELPSSSHRIMQHSIQVMQESFSELPNGPIVHDIRIMQRSVLQERLPSKRPIIQDIQIIKPSSYTLQHEEFVRMRGATEGALVSLPDTAKVALNDGGGDDENYENEFPQMETNVIDDAEEDYDDAEGDYDDAEADAEEVDDYDDNNLNSPDHLMQVGGVSVTQSTSYTYYTN